MMRDGEQQKTIHVTKAVRTTSSKPEASNEEEAMKMLEMCRAMNGNWNLAERALAKNYPDLKPQFEQLIRQAGFAPKKEEYVILPGWMQPRYHEEEA